MAEIRELAATGSGLGLTRATFKAITPEIIEGLRMHSIKLTYDEILQGSIAGTLRQLENLRDKRKPAHGCGTNNDWQLHIEGALGELALAKHLGWYWSKGIFRGDDVHNFQVRTRSEHWHDLILHNDDPDDKNFYLVTGKNGDYQIRGWIQGLDGKQDKFWKDPAGGRAAFFVPVSELTGG